MASMCPNVFACVSPVIVAARRPWVQLGQQPRSVNKSPLFDRIYIDNYTGRKLYKPGDIPVVH